MISIWSEFVAAITTCDSIPSVTSVAVTVKVITNPFTTARLLVTDAELSRRCPATAATMLVMDTAFEGKCSICAKPDVN